MVLIPILLLVGSYLAIVFAAHKSPIMDFLAYMGSELEDIDVVPDLPEGQSVPEVPRISHEQDVIVLKDTPESIARRKDIEEDFAKRSLLGKKKSEKEEIATSETSGRNTKQKRKSERKSAPKPRKKMKARDYMILEEDEDVQNVEGEFAAERSAERPRRGAGKGPKAVRQMRDDAHQETHEIEDSDDGASATGGNEAEPSRGEDDPSLGIPRVPNSKAPFKVKFPRIPCDSYLDKDEEREDFIARAMLPARLQDVALLSIEEFMSSTNETCIRHLSEQNDFWRRWDIREAEVEDLKEKIKEYRRKFRKIEVQDPELQSQKVADIEADNVILKQQAEMAEQEVTAHRNRIESLTQEKNKLDDDLHEEKMKVERMTLEIEEHRDVEKTLRDKLQEKDEQIEKVTADRAELIRGIPSIFDKLRLSGEFAQEMGAVQGRAVAFGFNKALAKVKAQVPGLDVTQIPGYEKGTAGALKEAAQKFADKRYEFLNVLASDADLSAAEILTVPAPRAAAPVQATTSSAAPSGSVVQNP